MTDYVAVIYAIALALLWGYAGAMWLQFRTQPRRNRLNHGGRP
jgi:hypothetical protein